MRTPRSTLLYHLGVILACISFAIPLLGYIVIGSTMRYNGDDYCYASVLTKYGFWKAQWVSYTQSPPYNGNRYSLTLFSDLGGILGPYMSAVWPGLVIVIWLAGMIFVIRRIVQYNGLPIHHWETLLLAEALIFFTLYMAPSLSQILYWRSGMLPYLAPLVANTFLVGVIIQQAHSIRLPPFGLVLTGFLALLAGGFSEAATALQLGYLSLLGIGILIITRSKGRKTHLLRPVIVAWVASLVAFLLLAISPSNATILVKSSRPDLLTFMSISIKSALSFAYGSITSLPLPTAILFFFSTGAAWLINSRTGGSLRLTFVQWLKFVSLIVLICILLVICSVAPSAYIQSAYPELRALITPRFIMVLAIVAVGGLTGSLLYQKISLPQNKFQLFNVGVAISLAILSLYPIYGARNFYRDFPRYQRWVSFWDARDREIRWLRQNDIMNVEVVKIDHIIPSVSDLSEDPRFWYNVCAAGYYGTLTITADKPGWDTP